MSVFKSTRKICLKFVIASFLTSTLAVAADIGSPIGTTFEAVASSKIYHQNYSCTRDIDPTGQNTQTLNDLKTIIARYDYVNISASNISLAYSYNGAALKNHNQGFDVIAKQPRMNPLQPHQGLVCKTQNSGAASVKCLNDVQLQTLINSLCLPTLSQ